MKKIFLLIFTAIFIFSCNNGSNLRISKFRVLIGKIFTK